MTAFAILAPADILFGRRQAAHAARVVAGFGTGVFVVHGHADSCAQAALTGRTCAAASRTKGFNPAPPAAI